jgi:hypothetical protein
VRLVGTIGLGLVALCVGVACGDTSERPEAEPSATATAIFDGVVDAKEALAASAILTSDTEVGHFLRQYRATIGTWSAAEVEGSASGAYAEIRFPEAPIALPGAPIIRAANRSRAEGVPATNAQGEPIAGVRDLILERVTIPADEAMVDYYEVFVDLDTKTIIWLGPATPPPTPIPSQPDPPYVSPHSDSAPPMLGTEEPP